ncbi:hypothetical protein CTEN210_07394 [Chaetoceros tenuissimus]|uniref:Phosphodiester glycosidase domain-containing protein n=1 Tax=Chaetoceros tenuissimus TaxID=426638 RepID=A0AAD3CRP0_9STRA|nr:hypothetical protein CTEN210_07394 [Chaetoceros tenuissimus]
MIILATCNAMEKQNRTGYILIPIQNKENNSYRIFTQKTKIQNQNVYIAKIANLSSSTFRILVQDVMCSLQKTSSFAKQNECEYATNGGPFNSYISGGCVGLTISNGTIVTGNNAMNTNAVIDENVGFGITKSNQWVLGDVLANQEGKRNNIIPHLKEFVTGLHGWLVYNSTNVVSRMNLKQSAKSDITAPRTVIGVNKNGETLTLLQVDGCEHCWTNNKEEGRGLTLFQVAEAMKKYADYAINLDGGGSSSSVLNGKVINQPTCLDYVWKKCERPVASVVCIGKDPNKIMTQADAYKQV